MNNTSISHYVEKFKKTMTQVEPALAEFMQKNMCTDEELKALMFENGATFQNICMNLSKGLMPGRVSCTTYAGVVGAIARKVGVEFTAYAGFCLPKTIDSYKRNMDGYEKAKKAGKQLAYNHCFTKIGDTVYEYYNGYTDIDYVETEALQL